MLNKTINRFILVCLIICINVICVYAQPDDATDVELKVDPIVISNLISVLLKEHGVSDSDNWQILFVFHLTGESRSTFFSKKSKYNVEVSLTLEETMYMNREAYKGIFLSTNATKTFILRKTDLTPLYTLIEFKKENIKLEYFFKAESINFEQDINGELSKRIIKNDKENRFFYESMLLPFVLLSYQFGTTQPHCFRTFFYDTSIFYDMVVHSGKIGKINVPAGDFDTYKLTVYPKGFLSLFSKSQIWYQKDSPHFFVKGKKNISWYLNETWELIKIDIKRT